MRRDSKSVTRRLWRFPDPKLQLASTREIRKIALFMVACKKNCCPAVSARVGEQNSWLLGTRQLTSVIFLPRLSGFQAHAIGAARPLTAHRSTYRPLADSLETQSHRVAI